MEIVFDSKMKEVIDAIKLQESLKYPQHVTLIHSLKSFDDKIIGMSFDSGYFIRLEKESFFEALKGYKE